jgi:transcriptional regulator with XRE-family HTH domain
MSAAAFGSVLRRHRQARGLSVRALAAKVHYSKSQISDLENGIRLPHRALAYSLDEVLTAGGELAALCREHRAASGARPVPLAVSRYADLATELLLGGDGELEDMRRRTLLALGGTVGLDVVAPGLTTEALRHGFGQSLTEERTSLDEWDEIVAEYSYSYDIAPPAETLRTLTVDLVAVQYAIQQQAVTTQRDGLHRARAQLAAVMAMTVANVGRLEQAGRWWRAARHAAEQSRDTGTILWVRAREVVRSMYEHHPPAAVLRLAAEAERYVVPSAPTAAAAGLYCGKAQALALAGRGAEALEAVAYARDSLFHGLPSTVTDDHDSLFGWPPERLLYTESFVYSHLGVTARAADAQDRAVGMYPPAHLRGPAQIQLHRALCLVREGDVTGGADSAHTTLTSLPAEHHTQPVVDLGQRVLDAVPMRARRRPAVTEYADYLGESGVRAGPPPSPAPQRYPPRPTLPGPPRR